MSNKTVILHLNLINADEGHFQVRPHLAPQRRKVSVILHEQLHR